MKTIRAFLNCLMLTLFAITGCDTSFDEKPSGQMSKDVSISGFVKENESFSTKINNDQDSFSFINKVSVPSGYNWSLYSDFEGKNEIVTKTIKCKVGNNNVYLLVNNSNDTIGFYSVDVYRLNMFTVSFDTDGGTRIPNQQVQEESLAVKPENDPNKDGYSFVKWNFDFNTKIIRNTTIPAVWSANCYNVQLDSDGGTLENNSLEVTFGSQYSLPIPTKKGYEFAGWKNGNTTVNNSGQWSISENVTLKASWNLIYYSISYVLNSGTNNAKNPTRYSILDEVEFLPATRNGYSFLGWFNENNEKVFQISTGSTGDVTVSANWEADLNGLSVVSNNNAIGTVSVISGQGLTDETITVKATPNTDCTFIAWYDDSSNFVSDNNPYTFTMPSNSISLVGFFKTNAQIQHEWDVAHGKIASVSTDGNTVTYGFYPQTLVSDSLLISELNKLTESSVQSYYCHDGEYYQKTKAKPVKDNYTFDNGDTIENNRYYWFKCEPVKWSILSETNNDYLLMASSLLEISSYNTNYVGTQNDIYANNYKESYMRSWLIGQFYEKLFVLGDSSILTMEVDNSISTIKNGKADYVCENTSDKICLPSTSDLMNSSYGFSTETSGEDESRRAKTTDYCRANGAIYDLENYPHYGNYWTRSPYCISWLSNEGWHNGNHQWAVANRGWLTNPSVDLSYYCVRPMIKIHID